jgi:nitrile hydratase beta subunit
MNGIHDMGGMQGLGELRYEANEPAFHEPWEGRVPAMMHALGLFDGFRLGIEAIPAANYLHMSYYERWLVTLNEQIIKYKHATRTEIERGRPDQGSGKATPALTPAEAREILFRTSREELEIEVAARFQVGDQVSGRNMHPTTHTRMPHYTRGKTGIVERNRGVFALPDNEVYNIDPNPQHVYLIRFTARELWGEAAPKRDTLYIDMWEDYLEPA